MPASSSGCQIGGRAGGGQDDAGDVLGDGELQIPGLLRRVLVGVAEKHRVPGFVRAVFDAAHEIGEERSGPDVRDDERPDAVVTEPEALCHPVRAVVQLLRCPSDLRRQHRIDVALPVQDAGDGGDRDSRLARDVYDRRHRGSLLGALLLLCA